MRPLLLLPLLGCVSLIGCGIDSGEVSIEIADEVQQQSEKGIRPTVECPKDDFAESRKGDVVDCNVSVPGARFSALYRVRVTGDGENDFEPLGFYGGQFPPVLNEDSGTCRVGAVGGPRSFRAPLVGQPRPVPISELFDANSGVPLNGVAGAADFLGCEGQEIAFTISIIGNDALVDDTLVSQSHVRVARDPVLSQVIVSKCNEDQFGEELLVRVEFDGGVYESEQLDIECGDDPPFTNEEFRRAVSSYFADLDEAASAPSAGSSGTSPYANKVTTDEELEIRDYCDYAFPGYSFIQENMYCVDRLQEEAAKDP